MLSQTQIIRSLGEALAWLEKELDWGAPLAELRHLTGRIGELYAAMLTRGQMAGAVNQRGYDVVGFDGERISVKTVTSSVRVTFNPRTLALVDRIIVLRISVDGDSGVAIEILLDVARDGFDQHLRRLSSGEVDFPVRPPRALSTIRRSPRRVSTIAGSFANTRAEPFGCWRTAPCSRPRCRRFACSRQYLALTCVMLMAGFGTRGSSAMLCSRR